MLNSGVAWTQHARAQKYNWSQIGQKNSAQPRRAERLGLLQLTLEGGDGLVDHTNVDLFAFRLGVNCTLSYVSHD